MRNNQFQREGKVKFDTKLDFRLEPNNSTNNLNGIISNQVNQVCSKEKAGAGGGFQIIAEIIQLMPG